LVERGVEPQKTLALANTNKAREEMEDRLRGDRRLNTVKVSTLHKLGYGLIRKYSPSLKDDVADDEKQKSIIAALFDKFLQSDRSYALNVLQFMAELSIRDKDDNIGSPLRRNRRLCRPE
jgi:superfamily I DNA/RNA helicase